AGAPPAPMRSRVLLGPPDGGLPGLEPAAPALQPAQLAGARSAPGLPGRGPAAPPPQHAGARPEGGWSTPRASLRAVDPDKELELLQLQQVVADCKAHHQQTLQLLGQLSTQNIDLRAQLDRASMRDRAARPSAAGPERREAACAEEARQASALRAQLEALQRAPSPRRSGHEEQQLAARLRDLQREVDVARDSQGRSVEALEAARRESRGLRAALRAEEARAREQAAALERREEARAE
ncbi:unnamed protein product, partial [Prorocentrum cordatum]